MKYYISDLHLDHQAVLKFDGRPFKTLEEMAEVVRERWTAKVTDEDEVYILGDFIMRDADLGERFLSSVPGKKFLVRGNHDTVEVDGFESVESMMTIEDEGRRVFLCHYPVAVHCDTYHLYGHVHYLFGAFMRHSNLLNLQNSYNACCTNWDFTPVSLSEILKMTDTRNVEGVWEFEDTWCITTLEIVGNDVKVSYGGLDEDRVVEGIRITPNGRGFYEDTHGLLSYFYVHGDELYQKPNRLIDPPVFVRVK